MLDKLPQTILESVTLIPLPPLPQVLVRFLTLAEDAKTPLTDLATLVAQDPAFTAQILTVASSPPYRLDNAAINLQQSMSAIGIPLLRTLANVMAVQNSQTPTIYERNLDYAGFWSHSLLVAALARSLAEAVGYQDSEEAYLAGLLHDIGQLLLVGGVGEFCGLLSGASGSEAGRVGLPQLLKGVDPAAVGSRLVDSWQLPSFMADAVRFHQFPAEQISAAEILCRIVWAAHLLSGSAEDVETAFELSPELQGIPAILGIDRAAIVKACRSPHAWVAERVAFFGLQIHRAAPTLPVHTYIYPYVSLPKHDARDAVQLQLEALVRIRAVMQPVQQSLLAFSSETELFATLRETARLLLGLPRPVFLVCRPDKPLLVPVACPGQSPLLTRLEIALEPCRSLAALAVQTVLPCSSFDTDGKTATSLIDIQLTRLLGSQGLLCIPLGTVGVMVFGLTAEQYASKQGLLAWITSFARLAASSLETCRFLRQRDEKLTADLTRQFEHKARKVIHEAANPLGIINNYLQIFADKLGDATEVQQELAILKEELSRVERIVRRLNDLPERPVSVETVNVNTLIEGLLALYGESLFEARGIDIDKQLEAGLPLVKADRDSLKQILFNLWKNSAEAMPAGGLFRISTATGQANACCHVEIQLTDSGPGIPPDIKAQLFQPLAPDRRPDNSGVGLSIVASLVERIGGQITCDSSPGTGTMFTIRLEAANE